MPLMMGSSGSGEEIMLAPCIPFLLAFPGMCVAESSPPGEVWAAFVFGVIGYATAAGFLYLVTRETFDRRSGRTGVAWTPPGPWPGSAPPITADFVGEADPER